MIHGTPTSTDAVLAAHDAQDDGTDGTDGIDAEEGEIKPGDIRECAGRWRAEPVVLVPDSPNACGGCECHTAPGPAHVAGHPCHELCERGMQWKRVAG